MAKSRRRRGLFISQCRQTTEPARHWQGRVQGARAHYDNSPLDAGLLSTDPDDRADLRRMQQHIKATDHI